MPATRSGIPTTYRHGEFRSRLEARWAAFFDLVGWSWVYEPLDAEGYIPDFLIQGRIPFFVEVGPCITQQDYEAKTAKPDRVAASLRHDVLVVGVSPLPDLHIGGSGHLAAGWLGEFFDDEGILAWDAGVWAWDIGLGIYHTYHSYTHRPRGPAEPREMSVDPSWGYPPHGEGGTVLIERLWAEAGNVVKWRRA